MIRLALKLIFGERLKFYGLVASLTFAALLIVLLTSIYFGVLESFFNVAYASGVPVWVMDKRTESFDRPISMPDHVLNTVRSTPGVKWAAPYLLADITVKQDNGKQTIIKMIGISTNSFAGLPNKFLAGNADVLRNPNAVAIDKNQLDLMKGAGLGSKFEFNGKQFEIQAIVDMKPNSLSFPICYVSQANFISCFPSKTQALSYVLAYPEEGKTAESICYAIMNRDSNLNALPQQLFAKKTQDWYLNNTSMPFIFMVIVIIGMTFAIVITAQQFYTFVLENINNLAVLKSLGFDNADIGIMMMIQILVVGFAAYGTSFGAIAALGYIFGNMPRMFYYTPYNLMVLSGFLVFSVCLLSSLMGIRKMRSIEPATVFRM